jgi:four helix bundle suffix protein
MNNSSNQLPGTSDQRMAQALLSHQVMKKPEFLIQQHGGYQHLKSFQVAQLVYDITVRFCDKYISKKSRTHDQMVQAARSGVQNIAEGSLASGTSKKTELKLTNVARASLGELKLDYQDFLRQRNLPIWKNSDHRYAQLIALRPKNSEDVARWVKAQKDGLYGHDGQDRQNGDSSSIQSIKSIESISFQEIAANAALVLITVAMSLLNRQIQSLANVFVENGGFTERLFRIRSQSRSLS